MFWGWHWSYCVGRGGLVGLYIPLVRATMHLIDVVVVWVIREDGCAAVREFDGRAGECR